MSKKYEDGIWLFKGTEGYTRVRFLKDGHCSIMLSEGELQAPYPLDLLPWTPIRRVADLEGRPVVDASVIEAIGWDILAETLKHYSGGLIPSEIAPILRKHLSPSREQGKQRADDASDQLPKVFMHANGQSTERNAAEEVMRLLNLDWTDFRQRDPIVVAIGKHLDMERKARITPLSEPAERPIVDLPGAFSCWWKDGTAGDYTAWPSCGGIRYMRNDGHSSGWVSTEIFDKQFTRTRPITLPPEHERLVGPLAKKLGKTETEVRDAILEAQGV